MHDRKPVYFRLWIALSVVLSAIFVGLFGSYLADTLAQSPVPTATWTATPSKPTPTDTPVLPTATDTPLPPTPTDTPPPPTNTPTPIPAPPQLSSIKIDPPEALVAVGTFLDFTLAFTDPGASLPFMTWVWGDGTSSSCPPNSIACTIDWPAIVNTTSTGSQFVNGTVTGSHAYNLPGVYTVQVTVVDIYGQFDTATYEFATIYDPAAGFVTGGGWIDSWKGAYKPDPTLAGKATFGFVSEYKMGSSRPTGHTVFQFKVGDLNFHSDNYYWLVVNQGGTNAQFKGEGTINGDPDPIGNGYKFMIYARDGSPDTFRIRIWWEDEWGFTETDIYDNGFRQPIGGGSIVIHTE